MSLDDVDFGRISYRSRLTFHSWFHDLVLGDTTVMEDVREEFEKYEWLFGIEDSALNEILQRPSGPLWDKDEGRSSVLIGLCGLVEAHERGDFKSERRRAATVIRELLDNYRCLRGMLVEERKNLYRDLVTKLRDEDIAKYMEIIGKTEWIGELEKQNEAFEGQMEEVANYERLDRNGKLKAVCEDLDEMYRVIVGKISTCAKIKGNEKKYKKIITALESRIRLMNCDGQSC